MRRARAYWRIFKAMMKIAVIRCSITTILLIAQWQFDREKIFQLVDLVDYDKLSITLRLTHSMISSWKLPSAKVIITENNESMKNLSIGLQENFQFVTFPLHFIIRSWQTVKKVLPKNPQRGKVLRQQATENSMCEWNLPSKSPLE